MFQYYDDIDDAFQAVLVFYGIHADIKGLRKLYLSSESDLDEQGIRGLLHKAGLDVEAGAISPKDIEQGQYPMILILKNKKYAVSFPRQSYLSDILQKTQSSDSNENIIERLERTLVLRPTNIDRVETDKKRMAWFWDPIASHKGMFKEIALAAIFINILAISIPIYSMNIYDRVLPNFSEPTLIALTVGILLVLILDFFLKIIRSFILESLASKLSIYFDGLLMERLTLIPEWKMQMATGEKAHLFQEMQGLRDYYAGKLLPTLIDAPFLILYVLVIFYICAPLALVTAIFALLIMGLNMLSWKIHSDANFQVFHSDKKFTVRLHEMLDGILTSRLSNSTGVKLHRWKMVLVDNTRVKRQASFLNGVIQQGGSSLIYLSQVAIIFCGIYEIQRGSATVGGLVAVSLLSARALAPVLGLGMVFSQYKKSKEFLLALNKVFSIPHDGEMAARVTSQSSFKGYLQAQNISFAYSQNIRAAISDVSLDIRSGEKVGLIGANGAGKSTLAHLLAGLLSPQKGNMFLDEHLYGAISPVDLRRSIGFVPQRPFLFSGTIRDNILMGDANFSRESLDEAIYVAGLERTLRDSGFGLDMQVGEDGAFLSAGQRQALTLARALIHHPPVLVLDEPTSGMDHILETHLLSTMRNYLVNKTFVMVTHRTTLLPLVERLILLDHGFIKADGKATDILGAMGKVT